MAEASGEKKDRLIAERDKDKVLESDVEDVKALSALEKVNRGVEAERKANDAVKVEAAKATAKKEATDESGRFISGSKKVGTAMALTAGMGVGIGWALSKPFRWMGNKLHDWGKGLLKKHDEFGVIEGTEHWFAEKEAKKEKKG